MVSGTAEAVGATVAVAIAPAERSGAPDEAAGAQADARTADKRTSPKPLTRARL
jgi:hypothetical protein